MTTNQLELPLSYCDFLKGNSPFLWENLCILCYALYAHVCCAIKVLEHCHPLYFPDARACTFST